MRPSKVILASAEFTHVITFTSNCVQCTYKSTYKRGKRERDSVCVYVCVCVCVWKRGREEKKFCLSYPPVLMCLSVSEWNTKISNLIFDKFLDRPFYCCIQYFQWISKKITLTIWREKQGRITPQMLYNMPAVLLRRRWIKKLSKDSCPDSFFCWTK